MLFVGNAIATNISVFETLLKALSQNFSHWRLSDVFLIRAQKFYANSMKNF